MQNVLNYLNGWDEEFIELFYSIRINRNELYLQGHVNKETLIAVQDLGTPKIASDWIEISYTATNGVIVAITLTLPK